jgi:hypothetical protein
MPRLLRILATHSGQLANYSSMGAPLGIGHATIQKYTDVRGRLFMVRALLAQSVQSIMGATDIFLLKFNVLTSICKNYVSYVPVLMLPAQHFKASLKPLLNPWT